MTPALFLHAPRTGGQSIRTALGLPLTDIHLPPHEHRRRMGAAYDEALRFTFVRNPWDRAVSLFAFMHRHRPHHITPAGFKAWVFDGMISSPLYARTAYETPVVAPQALWASHATWVGRYEHLREDFARLCRVLDVDATLPHRNAAPRPTAQWYDDATLNHVGELYHVDVVQWGYEPGRVLPGPFHTGDARARKKSSHVHF